MAKKPMTPEAALKLEEDKKQFDMTTEMLAKMQSLGDVARFISRAWFPVWFGAVPYLQAMAAANSFDKDEPYMYEDQRTQVVYFLCNAQTWKGPIAKATKAFLKSKYAIK